jgi:glucokinase
VENQENGVNVAEFCEMATRVTGPPVVGIDLGGTKILAAVVDPNHQILGRTKLATPAREGAEAILRTVVEAVHGATAEAGVALTDVAGIGIGSPGPLDPESGVIYFSANLNVRAFALGPELENATGRPVLVQNDVRVGGYAEYRLGAGRGHRDILAAFVGTGIGGCLVQNGRVLTGFTGNAGELGHMIIRANGPKCGCGRRGCLEAMASKSAITRRVSKAVKRGVITVLGSVVHSKKSKLKSRILHEAYEQRDPVAVKEVERAAHYLGLGLGGLVNVFSPEIVIVGGGVAQALGLPYLELVRQSARQQILTDPEGLVKIELAALGDDAGILGASLMARERFAAISAA